ncbi:NAD(P)-binding protein [Wolfiporia cocos MD-104 SS10]|uniref:NAD(P)-binding protein n=1 Tax=Wolfiporia cocos (strain MD-104) TaxID=742152 RepID=A0A2H3J462_WOLCO|nr:NAD(P)-binding protein [Wolfiporia cocos MD-104 SS10]
MPSYVVVGASRGIGLELVRQLTTSADNTVYAIVRSAADCPYLSALITGLSRDNGRVHVVEGDVADPRAMRAAAARVAALTSGVDVLIHNAARMDRESLYLALDDYDNDDALDADFIEAFKVNVLGAVHAINSFLPLLRQGATKKIVVMSMGGAERDVVWRTRLAGMCAYGVSKAGTNMVATKYSVQLEREGFTVVTVSPGMVDTSATTAREPSEFSKQKRNEVVQGIRKVVPGYMAHTPEEAVQNILKIIAQVGPADNGSFRM